MPNDIASPDCDHAGYTGCTSCGCSECGALNTGTLGPLTLPSGKIVQACAGCRGVVEAVDEEVTEKTVRAAYEPIGAAGLGDVRAERKAASA